MRGQFFKVFGFDFRPNEHFDNAATLGHTTLAWIAFSTESNAASRERSAAITAVRTSCARAILEVAVAWEALDRECGAAGLVRAATVPHGAARTALKHTAPSSRAVHCGGVCWGR